MHKIKVFIPEVIYGARNGLLMALFIPGVLHIMTYMGRLRAKGVPGRVGKCVISVSKKAQKD